MKKENCQQLKNYIIQLKDAEYDLDDIKYELGELFQDVNKLSNTLYEIHEKIKKLINEEEEKSEGGY